MFKAIDLILLHTHYNVVLYYFGAKFRVGSIYRGPSSITQSESWLVKTDEKTNPLNITSLLCICMYACSYCVGSYVHRLCLPQLLSTLHIEAVSCEPRAHYFA